MKQFNDKYNNVFYEGKNWRLYDENTTTSLDALYSETQIKLIELIENRYFKVFYFNCVPATNFKLTIKDQKINLETKDVENIKKNQEEDLYYLYKNQICEVFYSFLKLDDQNNYYFDFMLVVNNDFNLNLLHKHEFKSIKISSVEEIFKEKISYNWVKKKYEQRTITINNCGPSHDKNYYNIWELSYGIENYKNNIKNGSDDFDYDEYTNFDSFYFYKNFDHDRYVKGVFKLLCSHVWALDRFYYLEKNDYGLAIRYKDLFNLYSSFLTNYAEIIGCVSVDLTNDEKVIKKEHYTYSCILDNTLDQGICFINFDKIVINANNLCIDNLEIKDEEYSYE